MSFRDGVVVCLCVIPSQVENLGDEVQSLQQQLKDCLRERTQVRAPTGGRTPHCRNMHSSSFRQKAATFISDCFACFSVGE